MFELFEHTADLGLRIQAGTLEDLFCDAGRGLLAMLVANPEAVRPVQSKTVEVASAEPAHLLFDWLSELLYVFETEKLLLSEFDITLHHDRLIATCRGETMDVMRHEMDHEVKAITYHGLQVTQTATGSQAQVIVDI